MRRWLALGAWLVGAPALGAEPVRLLVAIGHAVGDPDEPVLRHADDDAERVRRVMVELGGVSGDRAVVLRDAPADAVRRTMAEVAGRVAEVKRGGGEALLFVYVSSHARRGVLHLGGTHLPVSELRELAARTGAALRVLVVDACDSLALARSKGGRPGPEYAVALQRGLRGEAVVTSSGPGESAEEWEALGGSLFTHHLVTALRGDGDADHDGRVTLAEAYTQAYRRTLAQSVSAAQHAGWELDLAGTGELVLTETGRSGGAVVFPAAAAGRFVVASLPDATVVAEVEKVAGRPLRLAVPPGRYVVRQRHGRRTGLLQLELPYGGERTVEPASLQWHDFAEVALKGGALDLHPWSVIAGGALATAPIEGAGARLAPGLQIRRDAGAWWLSAQAQGGVRAYRGIGLGITETFGELSLCGGRRWLGAPWVPHLGWCGRALIVRQAFRRDAEERIQRVFGVAALADRLTPGGAAALTLGVQIPLFSRVFLWTEASPGARLLPSDAQPALSFGVDGFAGIGWRP